MENVPSNMIVWALQHPGNLLMFAQDDFVNVRGLNNNIYPGFYGVCGQRFILGGTFYGSRM